MISTSTSSILASDAMAASSNGALRDLLTSRQGEINREFDARVQSYIHDALEQHDFSKADWGVRVFYQAGAITSNPHRQATALYQQGVLYAKKGNQGNAIGALRNGIKKCDGLTARESVELKAISLRLLGSLLGNVSDNRQEGLQFLEQSKQLFEQLGDSTAARDVIEQTLSLEQSPGTSALSPSLGDIARDVLESQRKLAELRGHIGQETERLNQLQADSSDLAQRVTDLKQQADRLQAENARHSTVNAQLNSLLPSLRQQVASLQTCTRIPLWAAVIRADMALGVLSDASLALLERMRSVEPDVAYPLLAEIRARNHLVPGEPFDLAGLSGEARLFAGIANSLLVEKTDTLKSVEVLLDIWEEYLQQVNTPAH